MEKIKWVDLHLDNGSIFTFKGDDFKAIEVDNEMGVYINEGLNIEETFVENVLLELKGYMDMQKYLKELQGQTVNKVTIVLEGIRKRFSIIESKQPSEMLGKENRGKVEAK